MEDCRVDTPTSVDSEVSSPYGTAHQVVYGLCGVCPGGCGVEIHLENGKISRLAPWKDHTQGMCCPRGAHAPEIVYSNDRLLYPMRRIGKRGDGHFERISWDQALDTIAENLRTVTQRYGPQAICVYTGRGVFDWTLCHLLTPAGVRESSAWSLFFPLGSPNTTGVGSICYVAHGIIAPATTFGVWELDMYPDIENAELVVIWGGNPATDSPPVNYHRVCQARRRGAEIIVIDHRRNETARATNAKWLGIRPGTDGALALAMIHVVIAEELYDREFVKQWTVGFEELKEYVTEFTPEKAEEITWVPAEEIRRTARAIARAQGACLVSYTGLEYTNSGTQNIRAVLVLWALTGNLDVPGGKVIKMRGADFPVNQSRRVEPPENPPPIGKDRYPLYYLYRREAHAMELPRAILQNDPYPLRAMMIVGSSIITGYPNPEMWRSCFNALDFMVVVDRFLTADALYADIVLPATTLFENQGYMVYGSTFQIRERIIEPLGEARSDWDIAIAVANRLGYGYLYPASQEDVIRWALDGSGFDLETVRAHPKGVTWPQVAQQYRKWELGLLRRDGQPGFKTPSGKFEIASSILAAYGYDPLPVYTEPKEGPISTPELAREYPLVFNSGARIQSDFRSQHHNIPGLLKMQPKPLVTLHPRDAAPRGIRSGDAVWVITPRGRVRYTARVSEDIVPGVIEANMGGGSPIASPPWRECNVNVLIDPDNRDPISGFPVYKALLCDVVRISPDSSSDT
ncbi:MAG: molybdopterin-containing oxidoreductase family protein [Anaerolineae bacterium]